MAVTMRNVARRAGVSIKTVSRVVNEQREVSEGTRKKVLATIEDLGYRPNVLARGLVSGRTLSVGLIIPQITDPFFPEVVLGVEDVAHQRGYSVFLCNASEDPQQELDYVELLAAKQVDGFILCGSRLDSKQLSRVASRYPVSTLTSRTPSGVAVVSIPGEQGLYDLTYHLVRLGHQAVGYVGWASPDRDSRLRGYRRAMQENGIAVCDAWIGRVVSNAIDDGHYAAQQVLMRAPELTAIACYNDLVAIGVLKACAAMGRRVPQDVAVVGFDDIPLASLVSPTLTTVRVPRYSLGKMVMQLLLRVMEAEGAHQERLVVDTELVVRGSCGASLPRKEREKDG